MGNRILASLSLFRNRAMLNSSYDATYLCGSGSARPKIASSGRYLGAGAGPAPGAAACGLRAGAGLVAGAGAATAGVGFTDGSSMLMAESGKRVQYWFLPNSEMPI